MNGFLGKKTGLAVFVLVCLLMAVPLAFAWAVNVESALLTVFGVDQHLALHWPAWAYASSLRWSKDLSTVSFLAPLLALICPIVVGGRELWRCRAAVLAPSLRARVYPANWSSFMLSLGLGGTLFGLLIGLAGAGLEDAALIDASTWQTQSALDRLLAATSTALLSSLAALGTVFLSYCINRIYIWMTAAYRDHLPELSVQDVLSACLTHIGGLSLLVESLTTRFVALGSIVAPARVEQILESVLGQQREIKETNTKLDTIVELLSEGNRLRKQENASRRCREKRRDAVTGARLSAVCQGLEAIETGLDANTTLSRNAQRDRMNLMMAVATSFNGNGQDPSANRAEPNHDKR